MALDTQEHIRQKQLEIIASKTPEERFLLGCDTIDAVRTIVESSIRQQNPGISAIELKIAVFRRYYKNDFPSEKLDEIATAMRKWHEANCLNKH